MDKESSREIVAAFNRRFARAVDLISADRFVVEASAVLRIKICIESPPIANLQSVIFHLKYKGVPIF